MAGIADEAVPPGRTDDNGVSDDENRNSKDLNEVSRRPSKASASSLFRVLHNICECEMSVPR